MQSRQMMGLVLTLAGPPALPKLAGLGTPPVLAILPMT